MSNFSITALSTQYTYSSANIYSYLGRLPSSNRKLQDAFNEFGIRPTGNQSTDLKRLKNAMYEEYSAQVQEQINNQNDNTNEAPWAGLLAQIGVSCTGDYETDYAAFNNAIQLLSQSAIDGQAMAYFAGLRSEAQSVFGSYTQPETQDSLSFYNFETQHLA